MSNVVTYNASWTGTAMHMAPLDVEYKCIRGPVGCLPRETEVMTPGGWVGIGEYVEGTPILQWADGACRFGVPRKYIVGACEEMLRFDCGRHMSMTVTENHRVPLYDRRGAFCVKSAWELAMRPSRHIVPVAWGGVSGEGCGLGEWELRLWVATAADGHYPKRGGRCVFCFRRERKVARLEMLLGRCGIRFARREKRRRDGAVETEFSFARTGLPKHLDWRLASCSRREAEVVVDEMRYWDGLYDAGYDRFSTTDRADAEIIQFLAHSCGRNATISHYDDGRGENLARNYSVHIARAGSAKNRVGFRGDNLEVSRVATSDGRQYCFETDTGFFVVRQEGRIFVTGNSGKSVACCWDLRLMAEKQVIAEVREDGQAKRIKWSKFLVGRHSYPALTATTIETWLQWFPQTVMHMSSPMTGRLELPSMEDSGVTVRIDLVFYAFESKNIRNDLMSLELSGAFMNEASQISWKLIDEMHGRIGRFQPVKGVKLRSFPVVMDTNPPDESNWWYRKEVVEKPDKMLFFVQPPALLTRKRPDGTVYYVDNDGRDFEKFGIRPAENVENLKEGFYYWHKQTVGADPDKVKRLILNQFGTSVEGRPVYPEYNDEIHCRKSEIKYQRGLTLLMGSDFGRTPATVIAQLGMDGVLYVLDEVTAENMSSDQFIEQLLRPLLTNKYGFPNCPHINFGDPAGQNYNEVVSVSAIETFNRYGIRTKAAPGLKNNEFQIRIDAVSRLLRRSYKGVAALQIGENCKMLRKGFNGYYCYRKLRTGVDGDERYTPEADKNRYSHVHDAFQYLCVGAFENGVDYSLPTGELGMRRSQYSAEDFGCDFDLV